MSGTKTLFDSTTPTHIRFKKYYNSSQINKLKALKIYNILQEKWGSKITYDKVKNNSVLHSNQ